MDESLNTNKYRYERKFVISNLDRNSVETIIKLNSLNFRTLFPSRKINNIYLDTIGLNCFNQNIDGTSNRHKYRIRWYGSSYKYIKKPILEKKNRKNYIGSKELFSLNSFNFTKLTTGKDILRTLAESNLPQRLKENIKLYFPNLFSGYTRKYFISNNHKYRITLDYNLFFVKFGINTNNFLVKHYDKKSIILEIKYNFQDDEDLRDITRQFNFRLGKNSKYTAGIFNLY